MMVELGHGAIHRSDGGNGRFVLGLSYDLVNIIALLSIHNCWNSFVDHTLQESRHSFRGS
jgi:hypothetical protein